MGNYTKQWEVRDPWRTRLTWRNFMCRAGRHEWGAKMDAVYPVCIHCGKMRMPW